jgi:hypothetical protein
MTSMTYFPTRSYFLLSRPPNHTRILWIHQGNNPFMSSEPSWPNLVWKHHYNTPRGVVY